MQTLEDLAARPVIIQLSASDIEARVMSDFCGSMASGPSRTASMSAWPVGGSPLAASLESSSIAIAPGSANEIFIANVRDSQHH